VTGVSVAWGNVVLADHGETVNDDAFGVVPEPRLLRRPADAGHCHPAERVPVPPRFQPALKDLPLTQACPRALAQPAASELKTSPDSASPTIRLTSDPAGNPATWKPQRDLLNSSATATEFVVEVEHDGSTRVRFGDDAHGMRPEPGTKFTATYRVGNGTAGNVGAEALFHVVTDVPVVTGAQNPMPARGGVEPETAEEVRHRAPEAFRTQERAVTEADYAEMAGRHERVQRAPATFRWTGSWHTVFVTPDPRGGLTADAQERVAFEQGVLARLERYRMAGHDLEADEPRYVSLEIEMHVCVKPGYFRSAVRRALLEVFSNRLLPDGRRGVFHPDHFTFGQAVHLSPLYAAAQAVPGVESVHVTTFQRQGQPAAEALQLGRLKIDRLEIARLDNDPNFPERGVFRLHLGGGK
jgi:predicted phage baseplate assembly protein